MQALESGHATQETFDRQDLADLRGEIDDLVARLAESERSAAEARTQLTSVRANYERLKGRRVVRLGLAAAGLSRRLRDAVPGRQAMGRAAAARRTRKTLDSLRANRRTAPTSGLGTVSVIVPTHDGADLLEVFLKGLATVAYEHVELVVVDNASTDRTADLLRSFDALPTTVVRNESNRTFSEACNQGAAVAGGDHLLFANNDLEAIDAHWLGAMLETMAADGATAAVGALLVYPPHAEGTEPLTVQHRGIAFTWVDGHPRPVNLGAGESPLDLDPRRTTTVPAATAACLLVERAAFEEVGGFTEAYRYGWEDVDLCMKLREGRREVQVTHRALLLHHEFGTQSKMEQRTRRANYLTNSAAFTTRWGARVRRLYHEDLLARRGIWVAAPTGTIGLTVTDQRREAGFGDWYTAHELGDALEAEGWRVVYLERREDRWHSPDIEVDIVIALLSAYDPRNAPPGALTVAWVRNWVDRWIENPGFAAYSLVFASTTAFARAIERRTAQTVELMPLATNPDRFRPVDARPDLTSDLALAANVWGHDRKTLDHLEVRDHEQLAIYGLGWESTAGAPHWRGSLDYDDLPALYSSVSIVLDDTVAPNRPALNSRVFDALASGALVVTDNVGGAEEWFDGLLPSWSTRQELRAHLDRYLTDPSARSEIVGELRRVVLERHTYRHRSAHVLESLSAQVARPAIDLRICPPDWKVAHRWGDTHFALDTARALRRLGYRTSLTPHRAWDLPARQLADVVLHIRGLHPYSPKPGPTNLMWIISHPDDVDAEEANRYDQVFAAGPGVVAQLAAEVVPPPLTLLQATDPDRFAPGPDVPDLRTEVVFVGNSRGVDRPVVSAAIEAGVPLTVFGSDWVGRIPASLIAADLLDNTRVGDAYRSTRVVLNDHWSDMASSGIVSNRIFDALATGTPVITDDVAGLEDLGLVGLLTFDDATDLKDRVNGILEDPERFDPVVLAEQIRSAHTFSHRAAVLDETVRRLAPTGWGRPTWPANE